MRQLLFIAALISTGLLPGGEPAEATTAVLVTTPASTSPASVDRAYVDQALLDAVHAQFAQGDVRVRLAPATIVDAGPAQREAHADGRVLLANGSEWIPFRVVALYDLESGIATTTSFELDTPDPEADAQPAGTASPGLARKLQAEASRKLRQEFAGQPAGIEFARVQVREAGDYLAVLADGRADFGAEGGAQATVRALYDPRDGRWLRLDYELGDAG